MVNFKPSWLKVILTIIIALIVFYFFLSIAGICNTTSYKCSLLPMIVNQPLIYIYLVIDLLVIYCVISLVQKPKKN